MISFGCNYPKLKTNLQLCITRLKLLIKKKTELAQRSRKELADSLAEMKIERSRIRVEHIIQEDYLIEAMEQIEIYCEVILSHFGVVEKMRTLDKHLFEAVSSILWVAPRIEAHVPELKIVAKQLAVKYGRYYAASAREKKSMVNEKLIYRISPSPPSKIQVEKYLVEIAKSYNVPYEPDFEILSTEIKEQEEKIPPLIEIDTCSDFNFEHLNEPRFDFEPSAPPSYESVLNADNDATRINEVMNFTVSPKQSQKLPDDLTSDMMCPATSFSYSVDSGKTSNPEMTQEKLTFENLPSFPLVPSTSLPDVEEEEVDFKDLLKRFENLKKRE